MLAPPIRPPRVARGALFDARGAVFIEKLIAYAPLLLLFFLGFQLAELSAAQLIVARASGAAGRAAAVVLPDDPVFYDGVPTHTLEGSRLDDVQLAAAMILSAAPQTGADRPMSRLSGRKTSDFTRFPLGPNTEKTSRTRQHPD